MADPQFTPIDQSSLRDSAYQALKNAFTRGAYAPGDVLSLRSLAEQLGISMTPVREAVRRLVAEGALIDTRSRTLLVPQFSLRRMADLKSARLALETLVLEQAIKNIDATGIEQLVQILNTPSTPDQTDPDLLQNYNFHFTLYRHCASEILLPMVEALWVQYGTYLNLIITHPSSQQIADHTHHFEIIDALRKNDVRAAKEALIEDIERSFRMLQSSSINKISDAKER